MIVVVVRMIMIVGTNRRRRHLYRMIIHGCNDGTNGIRIHIRIISGGGGGGTWWGHPSMRMRIVSW